MSAAALDEYMAANPEAARAALTDPEVAVRVATVRDLLSLMDRALEEEGVDARVRHRVGVRVATDALLSDRARARLEAVAEMARAQGRIDREAVPAAQETPDGTGGA
ncbi:hypothetical protein ACQRET_03400 [Streptomyces koyangensis]|uniref:hypothetical protein n=1 Tax=Streptomyces koyangensis TaxID=188770 RepID=UPI003D0613D2